MSFVPTNPDLLTYLPGHITYGRVHIKFSKPKNIPNEHPFFLILIDGHSVLEVIVFRVCNKITKGMVIVEILSLYPQSVLGFSAED